MRNRRNQALKDFQLADEMPFCPEENEMEEITSYLDNVAIRRVDKGLLDNKKRRLQSKRKIETKDIDEVLMKALLRLSNAVSDCFAYEHLAVQAQQQAIAMKVQKTAREQKANQLARARLHDEIRRRTYLRKDMIEKTVEKEIKKNAAKAIKAREEDALAERKRANKKVLNIAEDNFLKDMSDEKEEIETLQRNRRMFKHAQRNAENQQKRENIVEALKKLRYGMDQLDSQADKMVHNRLIIHDD